MSGPGTMLRSQVRQERREALRRLLRRPLILAENDKAGFEAVLRHRGWLVRWFAEQAGWTLAVEPAAGLARLHKVPPQPDPTRGAALAGRPPFDRRRYVLLGLTLAALERFAVQTTLARLAESVVEAGRDEPEVPTFDPDLPAERRAFVDVLRWLVEAGALRLRDGDADLFAQSREADALYDIKERVLAHLIAAPVPPALAGEPARMLDEIDGDTEERRTNGTNGTNNLGHQVLRRLIDDPVLYFDDLTEPERAWLDANRAKVTKKLADDLGLAPERRREGIAPIDPAGELSDETFPQGSSTVKHAALLLAEQLTARARLDPSRVFPRSEINAIVAALLDDYGERCRWAKEYRLSPSGSTRLAGEAVRLLERFGLTARRDEGWIVRPAIARFAPEPAAPATSEHGHGHGQGQGQGNGYGYDHEHEHEQGNDMSWEEES